MTDKPDERKAVEQLMRVLDNYESSDSDIDLAREAVRAVLATAPAEPPIEDAEIAMLRRIYITNPMPGWFAAPENAAANIRMLLERLSAPPSGEVAALIERFRDRVRFLREHAFGPDALLLEDAADALAACLRPNATKLDEMIRKFQQGVFSDQDLLRAWKDLHGNL